MAVMNLKESIVSSSFYHLIVFLLIAAASSYTTGFSGNFQNITPVDLTMENNDLTVAGIDSANELSLTPDPLTSDGADMSIPSMDGPSEEPREKSGAEKDVESSTESAQVQSAEKPVQPGDFASLEAYHQFIMMHKKLFVQKAGDRLNELLGIALEKNTRHFYGGTAIARLKFDPSGNVGEVLVESESPELKAFIEEIGWDSIPGPAEYSLGYGKVQITFMVLEGYMRYAIDAVY